MRAKEIIVALLLTSFLLVLFTCSNNKNKAEIENLKKKYESQKQTVKKLEEKRLKVKDSLTKENSILKEKIKTSILKVVYLQEQNKKQKEVLKNMSLEEQAKEFNTLYETNNASVVGNSIALSKDLPKRVLETIYDTTTCSEIVKEKDSQIESTQKQLENTSSMLNSAEKEIEERKSLQKFADENIKSLEKQNKKLKTGNFLKTYILPPLIFTGGVLIGKSL